MIGAILLLQMNVLPLHIIYIYAILKVFLLFFIFPYVNIICSVILPLKNYVSHITI